MRRRLQRGSARISAALGAAVLVGLVTAPPAAAASPVTASWQTTPPPNVTTAGARTWTAHVSSTSKFDTVHGDISLAARSGSPTGTDTTTCSADPANDGSIDCTRTLTPAYNDTYTATASGWCDQKLASQCDGTPGQPSSPAAMTVSIPPATPSGVSAHLAGAGVTVTWSANHEPDLEAYVVLRSTGGDYGQVAVTPDASTTSYTDSSLPPAGGSLRYEIVAVRPDGADHSKPLVSESSAPSSAVDVAPAPTTTTAPGSPTTSGPPTTAGRSTPPGTSPLLGKAGKVDLSALAAALAARHQPLPGPSVAEPDPGFQQALPYGARPSTPDVVAAPGVPNPGIHAASTGHDVKTVATVAAGLLATVLAMHGLWLRAEVRRAPPLPPVEPG